MVIKWRVGLRNISSGDEVVWDYQGGREECSGYRFVRDVKKSKKVVEKRQSEEESREKNAEEESDVAMSRPIGRRPDGGSAIVQWKGVQAGQWPNRVTI